MSLNDIWFVLVGVLLAGYAVLDGFDLGVGMLHLVARGDEERRLSLNSIGPVWDGNEVWLVVGGGALFAAFPEAYATVFSGFYTAFMLLLMTLIFRGVAIEFRSKRPSPTWRSFWDTAFAAGSFGAALLIGVAFGNLAAGVPLDEHRNITLSFTGLLAPYPLLVGLSVVTLLALHGAIYLVVKTEGALQARMQAATDRLMIAFILLYVATTLVTLLHHEHLAAPFREHPALGLLPLAALLAVANIPREIHHGRPLRAFLSSGATIVLLMALVAIGLYPNLVLSDPHPELSLDIHNAASSPATLRVMLIIAAIGMPLVLGYTAVVYWIFRGKTRLGPHSY